MSTEFDLIRRYFSRPVTDASLAVGDDAAIVEPTPGHELVVTTDTLVCGVHFLDDAQARSVGHKALAVNLSDLAAMGARPRWALLAITLPAADEAWLREFADGFYQLAARHGVALIGGDTTSGPLSITITAIGEVAAGRALRRDGAQVGDEIWVSGQIGSAALALQHLRGALRLKGKALDACMTRLDRPVPRLQLGQALVALAHGAIDVSDGLLADAAHVAERSAVRLEICYAEVPVMSDVAHLKGDPVVRQAVLSGGDDYELLFTAAPDAATRVDAVSARLGLALTRIGRVVAGTGAIAQDESGRVIESGRGGYEHFA